MARYSAGVLTGAGSTVLPIISIYNTAAVSAKVREIGVFNTTATAVALAVKLLTATGTQGAGQTETKHDHESVAAACTVFTTHTAGTPIGSDFGYRVQLGPAIGSGVIFTFGDRGLTVPSTTADGIGIAVENGTGQACQAYIVWDE